MPRTISLYGLPACGKTTQASLINKKYGLSQFGMGDKLRAEIASRSPLGQEIEATVASGKLISDEQIAKVLVSVKDSAKTSGLVFDGFPRCVAQAEMLDKILEEVGEEISAFILLRVSPGEALRRIAARAEKGNGRVDDKDADAIRNRLDVFKAESVGLIEYYRQRGRFFEIDGEEEIEKVLAAIEKILNL